MPAKTLELLKESIAHWTRLATGTAKFPETTGPNYCSLCKTFRYPRDHSFDDCNDCPVKLATGKAYCINTPYEAICDYLSASPAKSEKNIEFQRLAQIELDFLISLLPDGESPTL